MASCFKLPCIIYWISWFFYFSYMLGMEIFIGAFLPTTREVHYAEYCIIIICSFNIIYSCVGCVFLKCDIIHAFLALCFIGPLVTVNAVGSIIGLVTLGKAYGAYPVITDPPKFRKTYLPEPWFHSVERSGSCCGYWGFWDYTGFLSSSTTKGDKMGPLLPKECCRSLDKEGTCRTRLDLPPGQDTNQTTVMNLIKIIEWANCPFPKEQKRVLLQSYMGNRAVFNISRSIRELIHVCGCHGFMTKIHSNVYGTVHYTFYMFNALISFLMFFIYFRHWYESRQRAAGQRRVLRRRFTALSLLSMDSESESDDD